MGSNDLFLTGQEYIEKDFQGWISRVFGGLGGAGGCGGAGGEGVPVIPFKAIIPETDEKLRQGYLQASL